MNKFSFGTIRRFFNVLLIKPHHIVVSVDVLQSPHIDRGIKGNERHCPIALAVKDAVPESEVYVSKSGVIIVDQGGLNIYDIDDIETLEKVRDWVFDFDHLPKPTEPIKLNLWLKTPTMY